MVKRKKRRARGRPEYAPTLKQREQVAIAAGGGMSHEEIALGLGISEPTLRKHFRHELEQGAQQKRLEVLEAMQTQALNGNVSAQKAYLAMVPVYAPPPPPAAPAKVQEKGKKEQAAEAAVTAHHADPEWRELLPGTATKQ